jgi:phage tail P2-like protein
MTRLDIREASILDFLPSSIASDPEIIALSRAIDPELRDVATESIAAAILPRLADVPERVLDEVAWGMRLNELQIWDSATISGKQTLLANIFAIRKKSGTVFAVRRVFDLLSVVGVVVEWFEEGAQPHTYRLRIFVDQVGITLAQLTQATELVQRFARRSQKLREFAVESSRTAPALIYPVPATGRHVTIPFGGP